MATAVMLVMQMGASALLFPYLVRNWSSALLVIAASWPMIGLAECLGGQTAYQVMWASVFYVSLWLLGLSFWRTVLHSARAQGIGVAVASLITFGGPALVYLRSEYGAGTPAIEKAATWSPILGAFTVALHDYHMRETWFALGGYVIVAMAAFVVGIITQRKSA